MLVCVVINMQVHIHMLGLTVDFCITDPSLFEYLKTFVVHDPCILSDHCLMEFSLSSKNVADILHNEDNSQLLTENMYKWKDEHKTIYVEHISHQRFNIWNHYVTTLNLLRHQMILILPFQISLISSH